MATTAELAKGDTLTLRHNRRVTVADLLDTGRPAVFGTGTEWTVSLTDEAGHTTVLAAPTSHRWERV